MTKAILIFVGCLAEQAKRVDQALIEDNIAAAPQLRFIVGRKISIIDKENFASNKIRKSNREELENRILALHTNKIPEFIHLHIAKA